MADVLVCGSNRAQLSVLIFPSTFPPPSDLKSALEPYLAQANKESPSHAFVAPEMCEIVSDAARAATLPKSSKGTIQRGVAYDVYKHEIEAFYAGPVNDRRSADPVQADNVVAYLLEAVAGMTNTRSGRPGKPLESSTDLFNYGVDSVKAARLRLQLIKVRRRLHTCVPPRLTVTTMPAICT